MAIKTVAFLLIFLSGFFSTVFAQKWKIKNYSIGYRRLEMDAVGNNPFTISPYLKDPASYEAHLSTLQFNGMHSYPAPLIFHTLYLNAEWYRNTSSPFWKHYTIQGGLQINSRIRSGAGSVDMNSYTYSPDTVYTYDSYALTRNLQVLGLNLGINRRFRISEGMKFLAGLHFQAGYTITNHYQQDLLLRTYSPAKGETQNTTPIGKLQAKNYVLWQAMVPLGVEFDMHKEQWYIRFELDLGIQGRKYFPVKMRPGESHGLGMWLIYQL